MRDNEGLERLQRLLGPGKRQSKQREHSETLRDGRDYVDQEKAEQRERTVGNYEGLERLQGPWGLGRRDRTMEDCERRRGTEENTETVGTRGKAEQGVREQWETERDSERPERLQRLWGLAIPRSYR